MGESTGVSFNKKFSYHDRRVRFVEIPEHMLSSEPQTTPYDLRFRFLGMPVRIHPLFWLLVVLIGPHEATNDMGIIPLLLLWIGAAFLGILVHELGHALVIRHVLGARPWIVFYTFGGLACHNPYECRRNGSRYSILLSAAGPIAGFLPVVVMTLACLLIGIPIRFPMIPLLPGLDAVSVPMPVIVVPEAPALFYASFFLSQISIFWGLLNLLPIYPLDGGNIARELALLASPERGIEISLTVSIVTALLFTCLTFFAALNTEKTFLFTTLLFAGLAFVNFRILAAYRRGYR